MNLAPVQRLPTIGAGGTWYRAVQIAYLTSALNAVHSKTVRSRFNAGFLLPPLDQFEILYLADSPIVALYECGGMFGSPWNPVAAVANPHLALAVLSVQVHLQRVCDLTSWQAGGTVSSLQTNAQELTGDWDAWHVRTVLANAPVAGPTGVAPTQKLGQALHKSNVEGFFAISAKMPTNRNLVVFPQNLNPRSHVEFRDPAGSLLLRIP